MTAEWMSLLFMALALGMDAFSVSLGMGMQRLRLKRIALISLTVGAFHVMMPAAGIAAGHVLSGQIDQIAALAGGFCYLQLARKCFSLHLIIKQLRLWPRLEQG
ncbi:putative manganese efflux pump MntP [Lentibacillus sp. JNUCC-1]|nr:putative manganese efflux pump MntP [Lentibacillus sp. JNUCC-1]